MDLPQPLVPHDAQHRVFLLQLPQLGQHHVGVLAVGQEELIGQHRLQQRRVRLLRRAEHLTRPRMCQTRDGDRHAGDRLVERMEFLAGVQPQLIRLFCVFFTVCRVGETCLDLQRAAGDTQPGQPRTLRVPADFKNARAEVSAVGSGLRVA